MPKGWTPTKNDPIGELSTIKKKINEEKNRVELEEKLSEEISQQQTKLHQLIQKRSEYEKQVSLQKYSLESKIKEEKQKILFQTKGVMINL